jgi:hypothetical protein
LTSVLGVAGPAHPNHDDADRRKLVIAGNSLGHLAIKPIDNFADSLAGL